MINEIQVAKSTQLLPTDILRILQVLFSKIIPINIFEHRLKWLDVHIYSLVESKCTFLRGWMHCVYGCRPRPASSAALVGWEPTGPTLLLYSYLNVSYLLRFCWTSFSSSLLLIISSSFFLFLEFIWKVKKKKKRMWNCFSINKLFLLSLDSLGSFVLHRKIPLWRWLLNRDLSWLTAPISFLLTVF